MLQIDSDECEYRLDNWIMCDLCDASEMMPDDWFGVRDRENVCTACLKQIPFFRRLPQYPYHSPHAPRVPASAPLRQVVSLEVTPSLPELGADNPEKTADPSPLEATLPFPVEAPALPLQRDTVNLPRRSKRVRVK
jgi:hypothetical protein